MEAATIEQETPQAPEPAARVSTQRIFQYSEFVDVGEGAQLCEHARDGQCSDIGHFHAWVRLPNPYQHEDIRKKANAAKARRLRELRDPESDASVILEEDLATLRDETHRDRIIEELIMDDWPANYTQAQRDLEGHEDWKHVAQDSEEYARLRATESDVAEEERSEDFKRLAAHLDAYAIAFRERMTEIEAPKRSELGSRPLDELMDLLRTRRVSEDATNAFMETYEPWSWFVGTYKVELHPTLRRPHLPMWDEIGRKDRPAAGMYGEAPEVIDELKRVFNDLRVALQRGSAGN